MKYIGFKDHKIGDVMADLKSGDSREEDPHVMETYKATDYRLGDKYLLAKCTINELQYYKALMDSESKISSGLKDFVVPPVGIIGDTLTENSFVVTENKIAKSGLSFLIAECGSNEALSSDPEVKQLEKLKNSVLHENLNKGFMVHSYEVCDKEGAVVTRGTTKKGKRNVIEPSSYSLALLYPEEVRKSQKEFCEKSLEWFKAKVGELKEIFETKSNDFELLFPTLKLIFLIDFQNEAYDLKLHRSKRNGINKDTNLVDKSQLVDFTSLLTNIEIVQSFFNSD